VPKPFTLLLEGTERFALLLVHYPRLLSKPAKTFGDLPARFGALTTTFSFLPLAFGA